MAEQALITVKFEGRDYDVPSELLAADSRDGTRLVQQYIKEEIEEKAFRAEQSKVKQDRAYENEFVSIQKRLSAVESKDKIINNLQRENASLAAVVEAQGKQLAALEESGEGLGNASASARQTSFELSNAATSGAAVLAQLQSENKRLSDTVESMGVQLDELQEQFNDQASKALEAGVTLQRLQQEASNAALQKAYDAEARAAAAEAVAATALRDAEAAQVVNANGSITKADITTAVTAELAAQAPEMVNQAIDRIKADEFQGGSMFGPRSDGDYVRRQRSDATNYQEGQA